jgi:hypothetical protein
MSIITTALGLILVYLILSLIVSAAQEVIASWMSLRAKHLKQALEKMLTNEKEEGKVLQLDKSLLERFENHTHFNNLSEVKPGKAGKHQYPSYMSASTFATIFLHALDGKDIKSIEESVQKMENGRLKKYLLDLLEDANKDLASFRTKIEEWYDGVVSRVTGWYKRYTHNIIIAIGFLVALFLNADTISIYQKMSDVAAGSEQEAAIYGLAESIIDGHYALLQNQMDTISMTRDSLSQQPDSIKNAEPLMEENLALIVQVDSLVQSVSGVNSPLGLGWTKAELTTIKTFNLTTWLSKLLGIILTTLAISLGAPFWFDMLKKVINIRNAGPVHEQSQPTVKKDTKT